MKKHISLIALTLTLLCNLNVAQSTAENRNHVADWENDSRFPEDTFQFVRLKAQQHRGWATDYPDSDLNFSFRLQQMTSLKVNPDPIVVSTLDPSLNQHPFLYTLETGTLQLTDPEITALRKHLLNGGFLMIDDFWGPYAWRNTEQQLKLLFPNRPIKELEIDHPIFNTVFPLKQKPQVPGIGSFLKNNGAPNYFGGTIATVHYYAIYDDNDRMMLLVCHNTDLGDGWEREGENIQYFKQYSEKWSYPMGINIITYLMTN